MKLKNRCFIAEVLLNSIVIYPEFSRLMNDDHNNQTENENPALLRDIQNDPRYRDLPLEKQKSIAETIQNLARILAEFLLKKQRRHVPPPSGR